jgi:hypothetical protein
MTAKTLNEIRKLDAVAERAGGYVANPSRTKPNPSGEREFAAMRRYSVEHGVPMSSFSDSDYRSMGIKR